MSDIDALVRADDWPFTEPDEVELLLARYYRAADLEDIADDIGVEWFADNSARDDREAAVRAMAEHVVATGDLQTVVRTVAPQTSGIEWFLGYHYVVRPASDGLTADTGPPRNRWAEVVDDVEAVAGDSEQLRAFLRGLIDTDRTFRARASTDFSDAMARASAHYDEGSLWLSNQAEVPGQITGIATTSTNSGRRYR